MTSRQVGTVFNTSCDAATSAASNSGSRSVSSRNLVEPPCWFIMKTDRRVSSWSWDIA
jgi:hypothetical protein